jgi:hypothetical protein
MAEMEPILTNESEHELPFGELFDWKATFRTIGVRVGPEISGGKHDGFPTD